jgi:hypothetical protein
MQVDVLLVGRQVCMQVVRACIQALLLTCGTADLYKAAHSMPNSRQKGSSKGIASLQNPCGWDLTLSLTRTSNLTQQHTLSN